MPLPSFLGRGLGPQLLLATFSLIGCIQEVGLSELTGDDQSKPFDPNAPSFEMLNQTNLRGSTGEPLPFEDFVPEGIGNLQVALQQGTGNADLYVAFGRKPTTQDYDCKSTGPDTQELCTFATAPAGPLHILVVGSPTFEGVQLLTSYVPPVDKSTPASSGDAALLLPTIPVSDSGVQLGPSAATRTLSARIGIEEAFTFEVPANTGEVVVRLSGGTGDADLYVQKGQLPSHSNTLCSSFGATTEETCKLETPAPGLYYLEVRAYADYQEVVLTVTRPRSTTECAFERPTGGKTYNSASRTYLPRIFMNRRVDYYCDCKYGGDLLVDHASCGYEVAPLWPDRAEEIEWEHMVPAERMIDSGACRNTNMCENPTRECCRKYSAKFRMMEGDMHNLVPVVGQINRYRSDHSYGEIEGDATEFGQCDFEDNGVIAEPTEKVRGDIARVYFYFEAVYGMTLTGQERALFTAWDAADPVDDKELSLNERVKQVQGNSNPFVERGFYGQTCH